jgi:hypothetical protein
MHMSPYALGRAACVCRKWRYATRSPILWRNACLKTWQACSFFSFSFIKCLNSLSCTWLWSQAAINQDMHHFGYLMVVCGYIHPKGFTITWRELWLSEYHRSVLAIKSTERVQWKDALCLYRNMTIQVLIPSNGISVVETELFGICI